MLAGMASSCMYAWVYIHRCTTVNRASHAVAGNKRVPGYLKYPTAGNPDMRNLYPTML